MTHWQARTPGLPKSFKFAVFVLKCVLMIKKTREVAHKTYHKVKGASGPLKPVFHFTEQGVTAGSDGFKRLYAKKFGKYIVWAALLVAGYYGYNAFSGQEKVIETIIVKAGGAESAISVQGSVEPAQTVTLGFESAGKVAAVNVKVGDRVAAGRVIASLTQGDTSANIANQRALKDAALARLDELKRGARPEEIAIAESQVATAESQLNQARATLVDTLNEAYVKLDDIVRAKTDQFFLNPRAVTPQYFQPTDSGLKITLENQRATLEYELNALSTRFITEPQDADIAATKEQILSVRAYLDNLAQATTRLSSYTSLPSATVEGYNATVAGARNALSVYLTAVTATTTAYNNARTAVKTAENQLAQRKAGASIEEVRAQEAQVRAVDAALNNAFAQSGKRVIIAPFSGTVTSVDVKQGQIVSGASGTITLISAARLQVEAYVPEVYIAKIKIGDAADVTLDAYGTDQVFKAKVASIDPAATKKDGISTYKVVLALGEADPRIKSGMGGDINIQTKAVSSVITIPKTALIQRNGKYYVQIPTGEKQHVIEREVNVSVMNEADVAEVTGGISDGDTIVRVPIK
ncbi:MAG: hypothetical protein RI911_372 [Candidatus Parcubacteria bacterium]|jgi:HlyD family secretion protein